MKTYIKFVIFALLPLTAFGQMHDIVCDEMKGLESKAYEDIQQYLSFANKNKKPEWNDEKCDELFKQYGEKYFELSTHVYRQYRDYLNKFLSNATMETKQIKSFQKLALELQEGKGAELIKSQADLYAEAKKHIEKNDFTYKVAAKKLADAEAALLNHLTATAKTIKIPALSQNCDIKQTPAKLLKMNELLVSREAKLNLQNICSSNTAQPTVNYPTEQKTLRFQVSEGRTMMWICHQNFQTSQVEANQGNHGKNKDKFVTTNGNCLAYDLVKNTMIMGDQQQTHLFLGQKPFDIIDARIKMARTRGYIPLTYKEFVSNNRSLLPHEPKMFFGKAPKECQDKPQFKDWTNKSAKALEDIEKTSGFLEY